MALIFMESFDGYGGNNAYMTQWAAPPSLGTSSPIPRTGSHRGNGSGFVRNLTPATQTLIIGFAFYWDGSQQGSVYSARDPGGGSQQWQVRMYTNGKIQMYRGESGSGTLLEETASAVVVAAAWNFIEIKVFQDNSGTWAVKCNGATVLSGSGDTQQQAATTIAAIQFAAFGNCAFDDLYVLDSSGSYLNDFIGDCKIECLSPSTGNGSNTGLTTSTGSDHGALVDELPPNDDTDYNYGTTAGVKDTYNFPSLASTGSVKAVQVTARAKKTDSPTKELALVARLSTTDYDGATQPVATSYGQYTQIWEKRPSDNSNWTVSDVNGAEFGLKVVS